MRLRPSGNKGPVATHIESFRAYHRGSAWTLEKLALTRAHLAAIARFAGRGGVLLEYGSGESLKTRLLLRAMRPAMYMPVDISQDALDAAVAQNPRNSRRSRMNTVAV